VAALPERYRLIRWLNYENFVVAYCFAGVVTVAAFLICWLIVG
jgi:phage shock protein PspC (stress-responsive transcriptional regulator)